jgi:hypothetical protein
LNQGEEPRTGFSALGFELPACEQGQRARDSTNNMRRFFQTVGTIAFEKTGSQN